MIKFFRKIRQQLLTENKFTKYLLYAIGEVILVMVGILLALQVNIWNETRKSEERTKQLLVSVQKELLLNIKYANKVIDFYGDRDSIFYKVGNKEATYNDYKSNYRYSSLVMEEPSGYIVDDNFKSFLASYDKLSIEQDSIVVMLKELYGKDKMLVDEYQKFTMEIIMNHLNKLKNEKEWYSEYIYSTGNLTDEMIDYFLNDPFYFNDVVQFEILGLRNHFANTSEFRDKAIEIYEKISEELNLKKDNLIAKNIKDYEHYIGTYKLDSLYKIRIKEEKNELFWFVLKQQDSIINQFKIYPETENYFVIGPYFLRLDYDKNNNVSGLVMSQGRRRTLLEKVK